MLNLFFTKFKLTQIYFKIGIECGLLTLNNGAVLSNMFWVFLINSVRFLSTNFFQVKIEIVRFFDSTIFLIRVSDRGGFEGQSPPPPP